MNSRTQTCYCGNIMFIDGDEYLCPARFDGNHDASRASQHAALRAVRVENGRLGGQTRAANLTPAETRAIAQRAARARWNASRNRGGHHS